MTSKERTIAESQIAILISNINNRYETAVSDALIMLHGGSPEHLGAMELESLRDDLISVENDR